MKVKAKTNIKYRGGWYAAGEEIEISENDLAAVREMVTIPEQPVKARTEKPVPPAEPKDSGFLTEIQTETPTEPEAGRKNARRPRKKAE